MGGAVRLDVAFSICPPPARFHNIVQFKLHLMHSQRFLWLFWASLFISCV